MLGARQLRVTNEQLKQLRHATQLDGTMRTFDVLRSDKVREALRFVTAEFQERIRDDDYRREAEKPGGVDPATHKERTLMEVFEEIGTYVKHALLDGDVIYDVASPFILGSWDRLADIISVQRQKFGDESLWCNFEYLYHGAKAWYAEQYPDAPWPDQPPEKA